MNMCFCYTSLYLEIIILNQYLTSIIMYNSVLYPKVPIARDVKKQYNLRTPRLETKSEKWNNLVQ